MDNDALRQICVRLRLLQIQPPSIGLLQVEDPRSLFNIDNFLHTSSLSSVGYSVVALYSVVNNNNNDSPARASSTICNGQPCKSRGT
jgi:hypothetical protein